MHPVPGIVARKELEVLGRIVREAGQVIREEYAQPVAPSYKPGNEPVTDADRRSNELILSRLQAAFPGEPIVAEESPPERYAGYAAGARIFFVDPLDGTAEFLNRNGEFCVQIGVVEGPRAELGVVHAPLLGRTWCGARGAGAFRIEANGAFEPIHASSTAELGEARVVASRSHRSRALAQTLAGLGARQLLGLGSAGLKGVAVADGSADAFVSVGRAGKLWDACAIDALVHAAGARLTDSLGRDIDYRQAQLQLQAGMVAANPALHAAVLARIGARSLG